MTWQRFRNLHAVVDMPWLVMGDLNEIVYPFEEEGDNPRPQQFMQTFREVLDDCSMTLIILVRNLLGIEVKFENVLIRPYQMKHRTRNLAMRF